MSNMQEKGHKRK